MGIMNMLPQHQNATSKQDTQAASTRWMPWPVSPGGVRVCLQNNVDRNCSSFIQKIRATSSKLIELSGYVPKVPTNSQLEHVGDNVLLSWDKSECATEYKLTFKSVNGKDSHPRIVNDNFANLKEPEACSDVYLSAGAYGRYSKEILITNIKPSEIATETLSLNLKASTNSVTVRWDASPICINIFDVQVCTNEECKIPVNAKWNETLEGFKFTSTELDPCSEYTISVKPMYKGKSVGEIVSTFKTLSPSLDDVDLSVTAEVVDEDRVNITWNAKQCASSYEVFQILGKRGSRWETIGETKATELSRKLDGDPCTEYRYGVKVTINGAQSDIYEADMPIITPPGTIQPSLTITNISTTSVELSVDHAYCLTDYNISVCKTNPHKCLYQNSTTVKHSEGSIITMIENLSPCTPYLAHILITTNNTKLKLTNDFQTPPTTPIAPQNFTADFDPETGMINFSFAPVSCATSYKIYKNFDDLKGVKLFKETKNTSSSYSFTVGCGIRFCVCSVVNGTEGPKTTYDSTYCEAQARIDNIEMKVIISGLFGSTLLVLCICKIRQVYRNTDNNDDINTTSNQENEMDDLLKVNHNINNENGYQVLHQNPNESLDNNLGLM